MMQSTWPRSRRCCEVPQPPRGGIRCWFTCPPAVNGRPCGRRVQKLYLPTNARQFGCRLCYDLRYQSRLGARGRAICKSPVTLSVVASAGVAVPPAAQRTALRASCAEAVSAAQRAAIRVSALLRSDLRQPPTRRQTARHLVGIPDPQAFGRQPVLGRGVSREAAVDVAADVRAIA